MQKPKMQKPTRRQHTTAAFYLAEFTKGGSRTSIIHAFEPRLCRHFEAKVENVAVEKDFYGVERDEGHPNRDAQQIERFLANDIEAPTARILREVVETLHLPDPRTGDMDGLLWFAAFAHARTPKVRQTHRSIREQAVQKRFEETFSSPEAWARAVKDFPRLDGANLGFQETRRISENIKFEVTGRNWFAKVLFDTARSLHDLLGKRLWSLLISPDGAPDFVTSDAPGVFVWWHREDHRLDRLYREVDDPRKVYVLPLARRIALIGHLPLGVSDGNTTRILRPNTSEAATLRVAWVNHLSVMNCERFVFGASDDFQVEVWTSRGPIVVSYREAEEHFRQGLQIRDEVYMREIQDAALS